MRIDAFLRVFSGRLSEMFSESAVVSYGRTGIWCIGIQRNASSDRSYREVAHFKVDKDGNMIDVESAFDALARDWQAVQRVLG